MTSGGRQPGKQDGRERDRKHGLGKGRRHMRRHPPSPRWIRIAPRTSSGYMLTCSWTSCSVMPETSIAQESSEVEVGYHVRPGLQGADTPPRPRLPA